MVMTYINCFSKIIQLVPSQEANACTVADKFLSIVANQHVLPECITSNYDPSFCGHLWDDLVSLLDIKFIFNTASHPHTNRIAEVMKQTVKQLFYIHA